MSYGICPRILPYPVPVSSSNSLDKGVSSDVRALHGKQSYTTIVDARGYHVLLEIPGIIEQR